MSLTLNNGETINCLQKDKRYVLAKLLVEAEATLGHSISYQEALENAKMPKDLYLYAIHFGSFEKACEDAKNIVERKENPDKFRVKQSVSAVERAWRSREFQAERIHKEARDSDRKWREKMKEKREEILERLLELTRIHDGCVDWITEDAIKRDSILVLQEVRKAFGSVKNAKQATHDKLLGRYDPEKYASQGKPTSAQSAVKSETPTEPHIEEIKVTTKKGKKVLGEKKKPTSKRKSIAKKGKKRKSKTDEELMNDILEKSRALGRVISDKEITQDVTMYCPQTYRNRLGNDFRQKVESILAAEMTDSTDNIPTAKKGKDGGAAANKPSQAVPTESAVQIQTQSVELTSPTGTRTIPIQLVIPEGIKGTIQLNLEF